MPTEVNEFQVLLLLFLFVLLQVHIVFITRHELRMKRWKEVQASGKALYERLQFEYEKLRKAEGFVENGPEVMETSHKTAMQAIALADRLATQVPAILTPEMIREQIYHEYDPRYMKAAFLSFSSYDGDPDQSRNVMLTVIYGTTPQGGTLFRVYTPCSGRIPHYNFERRPEDAQPDDFTNEWYALSWVVRDLVRLKEQAQKAPS